jgi:hypothetical protein
MKYEPNMAGDTTTIKVNMVWDKSAIAQYTKQGKMGAKIQDMYGWITFYFCDKNCIIQHSYTCNIKKNITFSSTLYYQLTH